MVFQSSLMTWSHFYNFIPSFLCFNDLWHFTGHDPTLVVPTGRSANRNASTECRPRPELMQHIQPARWLVDPIIDWWTTPIGGRMFEDEDSQSRSTDRGCVQSWSSFSTAVDKRDNNISRYRQLQLRQPSRNDWQRIRQRQVGKILGNWILGFKKNRVSTKNGLIPIDQVEMEGLDSLCPNEITCTPAAPNWPFSLIRTFSHQVWCKLEKKYSSQRTPAEPYSAFIFGLSLMPSTRVLGFNETIRVH